MVADPNGVLSPDQRIVFFLFQQFLILFLLTPVTGAMSLAAHAVVGEKQNRTLEPLLATPITTLELLVAKVLGALLPALGISYAGLARKLSMDEGTARNRVKKLLGAGIVRQWDVILNPRLSGEISATSASMRRGHATRGRS